MTVSKELKKEITRMKTEFVSLASHQLRTPLTSINWYLEMMIAGDVGKLTKKQQEFLGKIYEGSQRMVTLVNNLLNISRLETGKIKPSFEEFDLKMVIKEIKTNWSSKKSLKLIKFKLPLKKSLPLKTDLNMLKQLIQNLLQNALKYSSTKKPVLVSIKNKKESYLIKIKDSGIGIPSEFHSDIFQKFSRASNATKTDTGGAGLGLYTVKLIAKAIKGKVWFESKLTKGTTFFVELPKNLK